VSKSLSWLFLVGFLVVSNAARGVYASHGLKPSGRFEALCAVSLLIFTWYWLMAMQALRCFLSARHRSFRFRTLVCHPAVLPLAL
jgi:hypothetical protein